MKRVLLKAVANPVLPLYVCLVMLLSGQACDTPGTVPPRFPDYFVKYYGEDGDQSGADIKRTPDGGFILLGTTTIGGTSAVLLVKVDEYGNERWHKQYGRLGADYGVAIVILPDGNYVFAANSKNELDKTDVLLVKTDEKGEELKRVILGDRKFDDRVGGLTVTNEGGLLVSGFSSNTAAYKKSGPISEKDTYDFFFPRTDISLDPLDSTSWVGRNGFDAEDRLVFGIQKPSGDFLFFGTSDATPPANSGKDKNNILIFDKKDQGGSGYGHEYYGTLSDNRCAGVAPTSDGGFAVVGVSSEVNSKSIFFTRLRSDNTPIFQRKVDTRANVEVKAISEALNGGFIITGDKPSSEGQNIYLAKLSVDGSLVWERSFGGADKDTAGKVLQLPGGGLVFIGTVTLENQTKLCLIKTDDEGRQWP